MYFTNVFYLTQEIQTTVTSTCNEYFKKLITEICSTPFFILSLQNPLYLLQLEHISIWTHHTASVQEPRVY